MLILPECKLDEVRHVLGRLSGLQVTYNDKKIDCRFSAGWTDFKPGEGSQEFMNRADAALYANKRAGKAANPPAPQAISVTTPDILN